LSLETTTCDGHTQTGATFTRKKATNTFIDLTHTATQVSSRPHVWTSATQTASLAAPHTHQSTQVHLRPSRRETFTQTARPGTYHRPSQTDRPALSDSSTSMAPVLVATTGCQAGAYFDNDTIPPGVRRPRLPWSYTYGQFEALLLAYPTVHPEDFITFGVLQEEALVALVLDERRRSSAPLGDGAYATLAAPGGPLALAAPQRRTRRPQPSSSAPPPHRSTSPRQGPSRGRGRRPYRASPGPSGAQGGFRRRPRILLT